MNIENKDLLDWSLMRGGPLWKVPVTDRFDLESFDLEHFEKGVTTKRSLITIYGFKGRVYCSKSGFLQFVRGSFYRNKLKALPFICCMIFKHIC